MKANKPEPEDATHDKVQDFNEESLDITLARVMTADLMLTRFLCRGQMIVKDEPEDLMG